MEFLRESRKELLGESRNESKKEVLEETLKKTDAEIPEESWKNHNKSSWRNLRSWNPRNFPKDKFFEISSKELLKAFLKELL